VSQKRKLIISVTNIKFNNLALFDNNKAIQPKNNLYIRKYSINSLTNIEALANESSYSESLISIIKELGINLVYIFENLVSDNIRKQILNKTKGLSGIYIIVNKITKDYYIDSAATNKFYARFSNHLI
jgi:hypothetical protein